MKLKSSLAMAIALCFGFGFASHAQTTDTLHLNFCDALKYLIKDYTATHYHSIRGKERKFLDYESKLKIEGFTDEELTTLGDFRALYQKTATSADEVSSLVEELSKQVAECTGYTPFIFKDKGLKNALLTNDKAKGLSAKIMISSEKVSKHEYTIKIVM